MAKEEQIDIIENWKSSRLKVFVTATSYTVAMILIIAATTYYIDQKLGTSPKFLIGGLVLGYPLTQVVIYKKIKNFSKKTLKKTK